jgi:hypothetical protein
MRPSTALLIIVVLMLATGFSISLALQAKTQSNASAEEQMLLAVERLGLSDLCLATDARYIRHLSVSDMMVPYMDHPGAIDHFPSSALRAPPY